MLKRAFVRRLISFCLLLALVGCKRSDEPKGSTAAASSAACGKCDMDPNVDKAKAFQAECDRGEAVACHYVGRMYENGSAGMPKDLERAGVYYERACKGGFKPACPYAERASASR